MIPELTFLHALDDELHLRANQIGIPGLLDGALGMLEQRIMALSGNPMPAPASAAMDHLTLDRKLQSIFNATYNGDLGSIISDLQQWPMLYAICYWIDRAGAVIIFWDPNHTISYNVAIRAKAGEGWAIDMCGVLNLLSPNHCEWALQNEGLLRLP